MVMAPCRRPSVSIHVCRAARAHWGWEFLTQARPCCTHRPLTGIPPTPTVTDFGEMKKKKIYSFVYPLRSGEPTSQYF